jgi:hypothetical protein
MSLRIEMSTIRVCFVFKSWFLFPRFQQSYLTDFLWKKSSSGTRAEASVNNAFLNEGGVMEFADVMVQNIETMVRQTSLIPRFREFASSVSLLLNIDLYI